MTDSRDESKDETERLSHCNRYTILRLDSKVHSEGAHPSSRFSEPEVLDQIRLSYIAYTDTADLSVCLFLSTHAAGSPTEPTAG